MSSVEPKIELDTAQTQNDLFLFLLMNSLGVLIFVCLMFAPVTEIVTRFVHYNTRFYLVVLIPVLLTDSIPLFRLFSKKEVIPTGELFQGTPGPKLILLYTFAIVILTGGLEKSPLAPLIVIVPLLTRPIVSSEQRSRVLVFAGCGLILIYICSLHWLFCVAKEYPLDGGWSYAGRFNALVVGAVMAFGLVVDGFSLRRFAH
ncbi:MAG: hypothetical protein ABSH28_14440 [Acidobacteriota bacterium]|jgi:hypothetical protein